jgi:hypothetical protein
MIMQSDEGRFALHINPRTVLTENHLEIVGLECLDLFRYFIEPNSL